ncbi:MAG: hypothetical protein ACI841_001333 [Planctomycetota bacterium]
MFTIPQLSHRAGSPLWGFACALAVSSTIFVGSASPVLAATTQDGGAANGLRRRVIEWEAMLPDTVETESGQIVEILDDGSLQLIKLTSATETLKIHYSSERPEVTGFRLEVFADASLPSKGPGCSESGNFVLNEVSLETRPSHSNRTRPVPLVHGSADWSQTTWSVSGAIDGDDKTGWAISPKVGEDHHAIFETQKVLRGANGNEFTFELTFNYGARHYPGRLRISSTSDVDPSRSARLSQVDEELQGKIDVAVASGVNFLLRTQQIDGSWAGLQDEYIVGQSALSVYALLKAGLSANHPSLERGFAYLRTHAPEKTYELGTLLMAVCTRGLEEDRPWIEELADLMMAWRRDGGYAYPDGALDVSCTQYAALGVRAAARYGVDIPPRYWEEIADDALSYQEDTQEDDGAGGFGYAGFAYRPGGPISGSRTVAGLTILNIAEEQLAGSKLYSKECSAKSQLGFRWLERYFSANSNPRTNEGDRWTYYYLYGVERLGALTSNTYIGGNDWYRDGARFLVSSQEKGGKWTTNAGEGEANTCFSLLFLTRATAPSSGRRSARVKTHGGADPTKDISLRVIEGRDLTVWIDSFGDAIREEFQWPEERGGGLRIAKVEYQLADQALAEDARDGSIPWRYKLREPRAGWTEVDFEDNFWDEGRAAFGLEGTPQAMVRTQWSDDLIWLRRSFDCDPSEFTDLRLVINHSDAEPQEQPSPTASLICLFDERGGLAGQLKTASQGARASESLEDAANGRRSLVSTPRAIENPRLPAWSFEVARKPGPGQIRYLRYSWRKPSGKGGVMLQLARDGSFGGKAIRYHAGGNDVGFTPSIQVSKKVPKKWTDVTCDLFEDFGAGRVTGISLVAMNNGEAHFDEIYLARSKKDFADIPKLKATRLASAKTASKGAGGLRVIRQVYLNGTLIHIGSAATEGYREGRLSEDLSGLLNKGSNHLAVVVNAPEGGQSFDVGIRGRKLIVQKEGKRDQAVIDERFGALLPFERLGKYKIIGRAQLITPPTHINPGQAVWFESKPIELDLMDRGDQALMEYASDAERNLLLDIRPRVKASSRLHEKWGGERVIDSRLTSAWICADHDTAPAIDIDLGRGARANVLILTHAVGRGAEARSTRAWRVRLILNGKGTGEVIEMDLNPDRKTEVDLGKSRSIRSVRLEIIERAFIDPAKPGCGIGEVELQLRR